MRACPPACLRGLIVVGMLSGGCMETRRALGEDCLKNDDCLSGICSQLRCAVPPPTTDARAVFEGDATPGDGGPVDAEVDVSGDAASGGEGAGD